MKNHRIIQMLRDTRGANMVEYIILVGVVAILAMAGFKVFGGAVSSEITNQGTTVSGIQSQDPGGGGGAAAH
jgi:Flp pilus assembly pilin Flp